jgi:hypothetical protein
MEYRINRGDSVFPQDLISRLEVYKDAIYMGDFSIIGKNGWIDHAIPIFYQAHPPKGYSNYFAMWHDTVAGKLMITSGASAFEQPIVGIVSSTGEVVYSRSRHDFRSLTDSSGAIDGGRDYTKIVGSESGQFPKTVTIVAEGPNLVVREITIPVVAE